MGTNPVQLSRYNNDWYWPGRPRIVQALWFLLGNPVVQSHLIPWSGPDLGFCGYLAPESASESFSSLEFVLSTHGGSLLETIRGSAKTVGSTIWSRYRLGAMYVFPRALIYARVITIGLIIHSDLS